MNKRLAKTCMAAACAVVMALASLTGCAGNKAAVDETAAQNRQFMASVNQVMVDVQSALEDFSDAVGSGDVVSMKTQAGNAADCVEALDKLEAPDALKDIKQDYVDGVTSLQKSLDDYIALYADIASATQDAAFNWSSYSDRIADIKASYDEGIAKLQAGDKAASEKE